MSAAVEYLANELVALIKTMQNDTESGLNSHQVICNKIHSLVDQKDHALRMAFSDLLDAASGYAPYPWNHQQNPFCETLAEIGRALGLPPWPIFAEDSDPHRSEYIEPPQVFTYREEDDEPARAMFGIPKAEWADTPLHARLAFQAIYRQRISAQAGPVSTGNSEKPGGG